MLMLGTRVLIWHTEKKSDNASRAPGEPIRGKIIGDSRIPGWVVVQCDKGQGYGKLEGPPRFLEVDNE